MTDPFPLDLIFSRDDDERKLEIEMLSTFALELSNECKKLRNWIQDSKSVQSQLIAILQNSLTPQTTKKIAILSSCSPQPMDFPSNETSTTLSQRIPDPIAASKQFLPFPGSFLEPQLFEYSGQLLTPSSTVGFDNHLHLHKDTIVVYEKRHLLTISTSLDNTLSVHRDLDRLFSIHFQPQVVHSAIHPSLPMIAVLFENSYAIIQFTGEIKVFKTRSGNKRCLWHPTETKLAIIGNSVTCYTPDGPDPQTVKFPCDSNPLLVNLSQKYFVLSTHSMMVVIDWANLGIVDRVKPSIKPLRVYFDEKTNVLSIIAADNGLTFKLDPKLL